VSDEAALLAAIREHPEEDTPRLVYADWLDEQGGPENTKRAEFIRVQIELARLPREDVDPETAIRRVELEHRAEEFSRAHRPALMAPGLAVVASLGSEFNSIALGECVRGFPRLMFGGPDQFLTLGAKLFELGPVHGLFGGAPASHNLTRQNNGAFLSAPGLARLRRLSISVEPECGEGLFHTGLLAGVEELAVSGGQLAVPGTAAPERPLARLRALGLSGRLIRGPADVDRLGELIAGARLTELHIRNCSNGEPEFRRYANLPECRTLERLTFGAQGGPGLTSAETIRAITAAPFWPNLRALQIGAVGDAASGDGVAEGLAGAPAAQHLHCLDLSPCRLTTRGLEILTSNPLLRTVTALDVSCAHLGDEGARLLAASPYLTNLTALELAVSSIGPKGVQALAEAPFAQKLVRLNLRDNAIRKAGVESLARANNFPQLRRLDLQRCVRTRKLQSVLTERYGSGVRFWF
jgi:uncharacterized protein (TIGR02996 family)